MRSVARLLRRRSLRRTTTTGVVLVTWGIALYVLYRKRNSPGGVFGDEPEDEHDKPVEDVFKGGHWRKPGETMAAQTVLSNKWMRIEKHTRLIPSGAQIHDWYWLDINDQVNIVVRHKLDAKFHVFKQTKYGLEGDSLAVVGGLIEPGEDPLTAAKRELLEEMGLHTATTNWYYLGKYRTDVNRGGGFVHDFLAWDCEKSPNYKYSDDIEQQQLVKLDLQQLRQSSLQGKFQEVKWSNAVALALLHLGQEGLPPAREGHEYPAPGLPALKEPDGIEDEMRLR